MKTIDDRTDAQKRTHTNLIIAKDTFMSGWGQCDKGTSYCAWACEPKNADKVLEWVKSRNEMKNIKIKHGDYNPKIKKTDHYHVYVVTEGHPSLK
jgi:hypothetical protein